MLSLYVVYTPVNINPMDAPLKVYFHLGAQESGLIVPSEMQCDLAQPLVVQPQNCTHLGAFILTLGVNGNLYQWKRLR